MATATSAQRKSRRGSGAVTLHDVAKLAGVAPMTASRALNTPQQVSEDVRRRVADAVARTGYVPNLLAGGLASTRSRLVAAVVPTITGPVFLQTVNALTNALAARGYQLMLGQSGYVDSREDALLEAIVGRRPDGIVLTGILHSTEGRRRLLACGIPVVETWDLTSTPIDMLVGFSHVDVGKTVARFLHAKGRRRFAVIAGSDERAKRRSDAFERAARALGIGKTRVVVVPAPTTLASALMPKLQEKFGQPFVVDNKAGATGTIGAAQLKRAAPDGYTFMVTSLGPLVIAPHLLKNVPYDAGKDFDLLTVAVQAPNVLVVPAASAHKSTADLVASLKANPGKATFASSGNGSSDHLTAELFWQQTGTSGTHVPYKGGAPAISDLLGGQVDASFQNVNAVVQHIKAGKLKALAVTGDKRSAVLPDVPTLGEAGIKGVDVYSWQAVVAPKGLPADVRSKMHEALVGALKDPAVQQQFAAVGFETVGNTPEQFAKFQQQEDARWKQLIDARKITAD